MCKHVTLLAWIIYQLFRFPPQREHQLYEFVFLFPVQLRMSSCGPEKLRYFLHVFLAIARMWYLLDKGFEDVFLKSLPTGHLNFNP